MPTREAIWIARHPDMAKKIPLDRDFTSAEIGLGYLAQDMKLSGLLIRVKRGYKHTVWRASYRFAAALRGESLRKHVEYPGCEYIEDTWIE